MLWGKTVSNNYDDHVISLNPIHKETDPEVLNVKFEIEASNEDCFIIVLDDEEFAFDHEIQEAEEFLKALKRKVKEFYND